MHLRVLGVGSAKFFALGYSIFRYAFLRGGARLLLGIYCGIAALDQSTQLQILYRSGTDGGERERGEEGTSERGRGRSKKEQCGGGSCKDTKAREGRDGQTGKPIAMEIASTVAYSADQNSFNQVENNNQLCQHRYTLYTAALVV